MFQVSKGSKGSKKRKSKKMDPDEDTYILDEDDDDHYESTKEEHYEPVYLVWVKFDDIGDTDDTDDMDENYDLIFLSKELENAEQVAERNINLGRDVYISMFRIGLKVAGAEKLHACYLKQKRLTDVEVCGSLAHDVSSKSRELYIPDREHVNFLDMDTPFNLNERVYIVWARLNPTKKFKIIYISPINFDAGATADFLKLAKGISIVVTEHRLNFDRSQYDTIGDSYMDCFIDGKNDPNKSKCSSIRTTKDFDFDAFDPSIKIQYQDPDQDYQDDDYADANVDGYPIQKTKRRKVKGTKTKTKKKDVSSRVY